MSDESRYIRVTPSVLEGAPTAGDHRLDARWVADMWWEGWTLATLAASWPSLDRGQVLVCCWYMVQHSRERRWKERWGAWAEHWAHPLWLSEWAAIPMPPQNVEAAA